jgi:hypothetical protein
MCEVISYLELIQRRLKSKRDMAMFPDGPPMSWLCNALLELLARYPSGVTNAIVLSELQVSWENAFFAWRTQSGSSEGAKTAWTVEDVYSHVRNSAQARVLPNLTVLHAAVDCQKVLDGTSIHAVRLRSTPTMGAAKDSRDRESIVEYYLHEHQLAFKDRICPGRLVSLTSIRLAPNAFSSLDSHSAPASSSNKADTPPKPLSVAPLRLLPSRFFCLRATVGSADAAAILREAVSAGAKPSSLRSETLPPESCFLIQVGCHYAAQNIHKIVAVCSLKCHLFWVDR